MWCDAMLALQTDVINLGVTRPARARPDTSVLMQPWALLGSAGLRSNRVITTINLSNSHYSHSHIFTLNIELHFKSTLNNNCSNYDL